MRQGVRVSRRDPRRSLRRWAPFSARACRVLQPARPCREHLGVVRTAHPRPPGRLLRAVAAAASPGPGASHPATGRWNGPPRPPMSLSRVLGRVLL